MNFSLPRSIRSTLMHAGIIICPTCAIVWSFLWVLWGIPDAEKSIEIHQIVEKYNATLVVGTPGSDTVYISFRVKDKDLFNRVYAEKLKEAEERVKNPKG